MNAGNLTLNWFDILVAVVLGIGFIRGKKRGMSEELLDVFQWLAIVVVAAMAYLPLGRLFAEFTKLGLMWSFIICYLFVAILIKLIFTAIKRAVGEKLTHADTFGRMEYYFGMLAGMLRWFCMLFVAVSLLHARYISPQEREHTRKVQADNFGSISFPTIGSMQADVFYASYSGQQIKKYLRDQLILPTSPGEKALNDNIYRRREREVDQILN